MLLSARRGKFSRILEILKEEKRVKALEILRTRGKIGLHAGNTQDLQIDNIKRHQLSKNNYFLYYKYYYCRNTHTLQVILKGFSMMLLWGGLMNEAALN